jgi:hypothetical protein
MAEVAAGAATLFSASTKASTGELLEEDFSFFAFFLFLLTTASDLA